ncbi:hypothetical protein L9F63_016913, partial [Diploptera punctata]
LWSNTEPHFDDHFKIPGLHLDERLKYPRPYMDSKSDYGPHIDDPESKFGRMLSSLAVKRATLFYATGEYLTGQQMTFSVEPTCIVKPCGLY